MENPKTEFKQFSIRVPLALDREIERDAEKEKRSKSQQVNVALEEFYASRLKQEETKQN